MSYCQQRGGGLLYPPRIVDSKIIRGRSGGSFECTMRGFDNLKKHEPFDCALFHLGGFKWKLTLLRSFRNGFSPEMLRVFLFSCNDVGVRADVCISLVKWRSDLCEIWRSRKTACPFQSIERHEVPLDRLLDPTERSLLVIKADLQNVRLATEEELRQCRSDMFTIHLEVIDDESIRETNAWQHEPRIVSSDYMRHSDVSSGSLVHLWAQQDFDCRYWLCQRSVNGTLDVKRCLEKASLFECFENICVEHPGGFPWVTVFKEEKKSCEAFQPIDDDSRLFFLFVSNDDPYIRYIDHVIVQKSMRCVDFITRIADEYGEDLCHEKNFLCLRHDNVIFMDITNSQSSLEQCGLHSGSVVFVTNRPCSQASANTEDQMMPCSAYSGQVGPKDEMTDKIDISLRSFFVDTLASVCLQHKKHPHKAEVFPDMLAKVAEAVEDPNKRNASKTQTSSTSAVKVLDSDVRQEEHQLMEEDFAEDGCSDSEKNGGMIDIDDQTPGSRHEIKQIHRSLPDLQQNVHFTRIEPTFQAVESGSSNGQSDPGAGAQEEERSSEKKNMSDLLEGSRFSGKLEGFRNQAPAKAAHVLSLHSASNVQSCQQGDVFTASTVCKDDKLLGTKETNRTPISSFLDTSLEVCETYKSVIAAQPTDHKMESTRMQDSVTIAGDSSVERQAPLPEDLSKSSTGIENRMNTGCRDGTGFNINQMPSLQSSVSNFNGLEFPSEKPSSSKPLSQTSETTQATEVAEIEKAGSVAETNETSSVNGLTGPTNKIPEAVEASLTDIRKNLVTNIQKEVKEPLISEINQIKAAVAADIISCAPYLEVCKANLMADILLEQLAEEDSELYLVHRYGQEATMMADDVVKGEPVFVLNRHSDYRMRISLVHKHQGDASKFRIKYISVKPSDGCELGLWTFEAKPPAEGNEVVALFSTDLFQSPRLSSACPQFGTVEERYVSVAITIGIEISSRCHTSNQNSTFELKGRILCKPASGMVVNKVKRFNRCASQAWRNSPPWVRQGARGAIILASLAAEKRTLIGPPMLL